MLVAISQLLPTRAHRSQVGAMEEISKKKKKADPNDHPAINLLVFCHF